MVEPSQLRLDASLTSREASARRTAAAVKTEPQRPHALGDRQPIHKSRGLFLWLRVTHGGPRGAGQSSGASEGGRRRSEHRSLPRFRSTRAAPHGLPATEAVTGAPTLMFNR